MPTRGSKLLYAHDVRQNTPTPKQHCLTQLQCLAEMLRDSPHYTNRETRQCLQNDTATASGGLFVAISPVSTLTNLGVLFVDDVLRPDGHVDYVWRVCLKAAFYCSSASMITVNFRTSLAEILGGFISSTAAVCLAIEQVMPYSGETQMMQTYLSVATYRPTCGRNGSNVLSSEK